jgi:uncharacterized protein with HEPN domain
MPPESRDLAQLWDMRAAARDIVEFTAGLSYAEFAADKKARFAVERQLLVIGEAASHVSDGLRDQHPEIPWSRIIGLRNILAHAYGEILVERIWIVATENVGELLMHLEPLIPPDPETTG